MPSSFFTTEKQVSECAFSVAELRIKKTADRCRYEMDEITQRSKRKLDHIKYALETGDGTRKTGLEQVHFLHNCLTSVEPGKVSLQTHIGNLALPVPVFIDAITGGAEEVREINRKLARTARMAGVPMAVGSQYGSVKHGYAADSYTVVREEYPDGLLFANVSALAAPEEAVKAVEMIGASSLEIHLNAAQELLMPEGDTAFSSLSDNLLRLAEELEMPLIIKETGCGMGREQIHVLRGMGYTCFDVAGAGGTSFTAIEARRSRNVRHEKFAAWGIPTAWSIVEAVQELAPQDTLIASGGIRSGWQAAQCLALGADAVSLSGIVLARALELGEEAAARYLKDIMEDIRDIMVLTGSRSIGELQQTPLIFTGEMLDFMQSRGYDPGKKRRKRQNAAGFHTI